MFKFVRIVPFVALARFYPSIWRIISIVIGKDVHDKREALFKIGQDTAMKRKEDRSKDGRGDFMEALLKHSEQKAPISDAELGSNAHILFRKSSLVYPSEKCLDLTQLSCWVRDNSNTARRGHILYA